MVRGSRVLFKEMGINKALSEFLACPLSKQSLRLSPQTDSLISDTIGASYPIVDGIPCLVPKDGKLLETDDALIRDAVADSAAVNNGHMGEHRYLHDIHGTRSKE